MLFSYKSSMRSLIYSCTHAYTERTMKSTDEHTVDPPLCMQTHKPLQAVVIFLS